MKIVARSAGRRQASHYLLVLYLKNLIKNTFPKVPRPQYETAGGRVGQTGMLPDAKTALPRPHLIVPVQARPGS